jgi:capsid protein
MTEFLTTAAANTNASYGELCDFYNANHDSVEKMKERVETLENLNASQRRLLNEHTEKIANAKALILEAYDVDDFSEDRVQAIAEALDIELTKEYNVTINVTFSGTITLPISADIYDIENYVDFEASESGWGTHDIEVDLFTDGVDVNVNN